MRKWGVFFIFFALACGKEMNDESSMIPDPHSYANSGQCVVTHLDWRATVDFTTKQISATATWTIHRKEGNEVVLDAKSLKIDSIFLDNGKPAVFSLEGDDPILGQALRIRLEPETKTISIRYRTTPGAEALQWLMPEQTAGRQHPFLFTQSQAILARTWIPCQDSPGVRFTYTAEVTVPSNLLALMSASNPIEKNESGIYTFEMKQPVPSYLLALTVGDIAFRPVSDRSGVYAEPVTLEAAAWEFADLEKMIAAAEELYGPYLWERYDVIVLPPSFPFGGMENPRLTFVTPTLLAGDRSLTSVIAHELAHSWSGNLVTNKTWNDFWLNEGFTVYFETRIMEKLYGREHSEMLAVLNLHDLETDMREISSGPHPDDTKLKLDLQGRNPDDAATDVAYNKGYFLLRTLEEKYGREKFDAFLRDYFSTYAFSVMDTETFIDVFKTYYREHFNINVEDALFTSWIYSRGLPADFTPPSSDRFAKVEDAARNALEGQDITAATKGWTTQEWLHFLNMLPDTLTQAQLQTLDRLGRFTESGNAEIFSAWSLIAVRNNYSPIREPLRRFLINTGRRKFLTPIYTELAKTPEGRAFAEEVYRAARPNYHFVSTSTIDKVLSFDPPGL
jgi:leukotriene A-4 hydrolase/aminopeptidase